MKQMRYFGDEREKILCCCYCGKETETRDHIPPKVFMDRPYPTNLPVVPSCARCNNDFSLDEEYFACFIECVIAGSSEPGEVERDKIRDALERKPALVSTINHTRLKTEDGTYFRPDWERVKRILIKLARGHAAYELNVPILGVPRSVSAFPLISLPSKEEEVFNSPITVSLFPEVGTTAMQRMMLTDHKTADWIDVQPGRYRYLSALEGSTIIRLVIREYLASEVIWDND